MATEINAAGGNVRLSAFNFKLHVTIAYVIQAAPFPIASYATAELASAFKAIQEHFPSPKFAIRAAVFNTAGGVFKPFLEVTEADIQDSVDINIIATFAFAKHIILTFRGNEIDAKGKRGTLIFTGATASVRGNVTTRFGALSILGTIYY